MKTAEANKADGGDRRLRKLTKRTLKLAESSRANIVNFLPKEQAEVIYVDTEEEASVVQEVVCTDQPDTDRIRCIAECLERNLYNMKQNSRSNGIYDECHC